MPAYTTVEYEMQSRQSIPPVFLLLIDTTVDAKELNSLKDSLQQNLSFLPDNALVGIISFGTHVEVHELSATEISRSYVFNGKKEYTTSKVADMLGLRGNVMQSQVYSTFFLIIRLVLLLLLLVSLCLLVNVLLWLIPFSVTLRKILYTLVFIYLIHSGLLLLFIVVIVLLVVLYLLLLHYLRLLVLNLLLIL